MAMWQIKEGQIFLGKLLRPEKCGASVGARVSELNRLLMFIVKTSKRDKMKICKLDKR